MGVGARVLPMADEPVRTRVDGRGRTLPFQEFMIVEGARGPDRGVEFAGVEQARPDAGGAGRDRARPTRS